MRKIKEKSKEKFGDKCHYELYGHDLTEQSKLFEPLLVDIVKGLKRLISQQEKFWIITKLSIFNFINHIGDDGAIVY